METIIYMLIISGVSNVVLLIILALISSGRKGGDHVSIFELKMIELENENTKLKIENKFYKRKSKKKVDRYVTPLVKPDPLTITGIDATRIIADEPTPIHNVMINGIVYKCRVHPDFCEHKFETVISGGLKHDVCIEGCGLTDLEVIQYNTEKRNNKTELNIEGDVVMKKEKESWGDNCLREYNLNRYQKPKTNTSKSPEQIYCNCELPPYGKKRGEICDHFKGKCILNKSAEETPPEPPPPPPGRELGKPIETPEPEIYNHPACVHTYCPHPISCKKSATGCCVKKTPKAPTPESK